MHCASTGHGQFSKVKKGNLKLPQNDKLVQNAKLAQNAILNKAVGAAIPLCGNKGKWKEGDNRVRSMFVACDGNIQASWPIRYLQFFKKPKTKLICPSRPSIKMASTYDASNVADSFEDLSSLSSNKDIESLVLATTYSDDDNDDLGKNSKATDNDNPEAHGTEKKAEVDNPIKTDDDNDDGFVHLVGADVQDEEDVLSEGWESSLSISPEPQCAHQDLSTKPEPLLSENKASNRLHQDDDTNNSHDKKDPSETTMAKATTNNNTNPTSASSIPRIEMQMNKYIPAALNKPIPPILVTIASSPPPDRVVASLWQHVVQNAAKVATRATATATTPDDASVPSPQAKQVAEPKKTVLTKLQVTGTVNQPAASTVTVEPSISPATGAAFTTTDMTQWQEEDNGVCKAILPSTGKRCTRHFVAGFSALQSITAAIAFIAQCNWSYMLTRMYVFVQWLVMFLSAARIGLVAYELALNKDQIQNACLHPSAYATVVVDTDGSSTAKLPPSFYCGTKVDTFVMVVIVGMMVDWLLNGYLYFVLWRFYTKMRLYPEAVKNGDSEFSYEEALDEV
ncbi:hypothetical protein KI688_006673 [Linnemannia hyalina]|uniref:Uncharacterized protein n=1 Tax=Linnemannia hyalina TaxID=64524 RepID=A0A9P7XIY5_9FUNG|nr:hypothetical protein KI688_006673 [Linnemannia hyalina]